ncbi:hypothetical protein P74p46 [Thermus phage P74-26]|uniref:Uncharacterized protein n=1 Tax=Thermus phage P74-26 TaxID=2914007 RepID=A7XXL6_BP742|nr:hypothetical protein P74p46 [Thermus phage P74-26]ABU96996.1 conserved hypothetical protein [Thermus phage P74-26]
MFDPKPYLMDLKGKKYLQVAYRILWLNETEPRFDLHTELVKETEWEDRGRKVREAVFKATVTLFDEQGQVKKRVVGWGSETSTDFGDFREKAETKAIGRALALAGFGTQFAVADFDEGEDTSPVDGTKGPNLADSPVKPVKAAPKPASAPKPANNASSTADKEKEEVLEWLKAHMTQALPILREALKQHNAAKVSDLPLEVLKDVKNRLGSATTATG